MEYSTSARSMQLAGSLPAQTNHGCHSHIVRSSLVPMRDLVHMVDGARDDSAMGRGSAWQEDGTWDLGKGWWQSAQVRDEVPRWIRGPRTENMVPESDLMISAADYWKRNGIRRHDGGISLWHHATQTWSQLGRRWYLALGGRRVREAGDKGCDT